MRRPLKTLLATLDEFPPNKCRLLARKKRGRHSQAMTHLEISQKAGLPLSTVAELSTRATWRGIRVEVVEAFALACGVDHLHTKRQRWFIARGSTFGHLKKGDANQRRLYSKLMQAKAA